jgi:hypothetical protein
MSYDPSDEMDATGFDLDEQADPMELRFGGNMVSAVNDVIVNVFGERWEDDDLVKAFEVLCETYSQAGLDWRSIRRYAESNTPGYSFPATDLLTHGALVEADLIDPVDH